MMTRFGAKVLATGTALLLGFALATPTASLAGPYLYQVLHTFTNSPDGSQPVIALTGPDNAIYGVTYGGGTNGNGGTNGGGTIYRINFDGTGYAVMADFPASETGNSNTIGGLLTKLVGNSPPLPLIGGLNLAIGNDGYLYGTTFYGGTNDDGTVFKLSRQPGSAPVILHNFGSADASPVIVVQGRDGALYGADWGGAETDGTLFRLASDGSSYATLYSFSPTSDGSECSSLIEGSDGNLYGTLFLGTNSAGNGGTVFKCDTNGNYTDLTNIPIAISGANSLMQGSDGNLYFISFSSGILEMSTNGAGLRVVAVPPDGVGNLPIALVEAQGRLYGTVNHGGINNAGFFYQVGLGGSSTNVIYDFAPTNAGPWGYLAAGSSSDSGGMLFGTFLGLSSNSGGLYSLVVNPPLSITPVVSSANGQTTVFWPYWAVNYVLQSTTNLTASNWVNAAGSPVVGVQVTATNNTPATYYRLVYPGD